jgi:hypothetical protein
MHPKLATPAAKLSDLRSQLHEQRWDDHRYYHHSLMNQSLHFISAITFLVAYVIVWRDPAIAALLGWGVAMTSRQAGHFFFEPRDYDTVNDCTHEHKEEIKVGYNLFRKVILMALWAAVPVALLLDPSFFGLFVPHAGAMEYVDHLGKLWLALGVGGLVFRTVQLFIIRDVETGLVWATKILTDPFNDFRLYRHAPKQLTQQTLARIADRRR